MAETDRFGLAEALLLAGVVVVAAALRLGYLTWLADAGRSPGPLAAQESGDTGELLESLQEGGAFAAHAPYSADREATAHAAPGYPYLVWGLGRLTGADNRDRSVRWLQAVLGTATAAFCFLFLYRSFHSRTAATLAGLLAAWHPFAVIATATIEDGVLCTFLLALALLLGVCASQTSGPLTSLLLGLTLAALALVRAAALPFSFVALAWFLLRSRSQVHGWLCSLLAVLGFVIGLSPWMVRSYQLLGEPVPVVDSAYWHLWVGNNPQATGGPQQSAASAAPVPDIAQIDNQAQRYGRLAPLVVEEVRSRPVATMQRRIWAGLYYLLGARWFRDGRLAASTSAAELSDETDQAIALSLHITLVALLLLAGLGWRWSHVWSEVRLPLALAAICLPLPYLLSHAGELSGDRLPFDVVLICYAALALACLIPGTGRCLRQGPARSRSE
jgi:hypothetical protein